MKGNLNLQFSYSPCKAHLSVKYILYLLFVTEECQDEEISDEVKDSGSNGDRNNIRANFSVTMALLSLCVLFYSKFGL